MFNFGSHLPVLIKLVGITTGPIVEFGSGLNSTVFLHWACCAHKREILTLENEWNYYKIVRRLRCDFHAIERVKHWHDKVASEKKWSIVFIDHHPAERRNIDAKRFPDSEYIVLHDAERYNYEDIYHFYKYKYEYTEVVPTTVILSNVHDLKEFSL